ncbi:zinc finger, CCHC-type, retrotransposon gag domain protein [Tanacetum coccineum]
MEGKSSGGSKQTPTKNLDVHVTKGEQGNEIKRIMLEHLPTILAQSQENFRKAEEARKAAEETEKKKKENEEDRKNAEDVERLRNEEAERRRRKAEAQGDGCSYKSFLNCKPSEFQKDSDPVIVTNWLRVIEDIFEISECSHRQRVKEMEGKGSSGSKQTPAKNLDVPVTKGELGNEIKRIMSEHLPIIVAQSQENFRKEEEARKAAEEIEKKKKANEEGDRCSYKSFLNCKPSEFHKDSALVIVTNWLREIEHIFEISECSPQQRVKYASHLLKGEARHLWNMIKIARGDGVASVITWDEFEDLIIRDEGPIQQARPATFQEAVNIALMVEKENNRQLKEGEDKNRKRENRDDDVKKIKTNSGKMENVGEYKPCTSCKKTYKGEYWHDNCRNCGKSGHTPKECKAEWVCFKRKSPRHKIVDCPERKPHDTQSQKTMGRVFQLTAKNA